MPYYLLAIIKFMIGFSIILTHMNLTGRTQLSQLTPVDFIGNFVLGGIIGGVIYSDAIPLTQYVVVLLIGVSMISLIHWISKHIRLVRNVTIGNPITIIKDGQFQMEILKEKQNKIDILNILSQMHAQGIHSFQEVYFAQIEPNGQLTIICDRAQMPSIVLLKEGEVYKDELEKIGRDETWLKTELAQLNLHHLEDLFLVEFWDGKIHAIRQDGSMVPAH